MHAQITDSTENITPLKFTQSRDSDSSVSRGTTSNCNFGLIQMCTNEFGFSTCGFGGCSILSRVYPQEKEQTNQKDVQPISFEVRGAELGSRPKKMYGERLGDGVEYHLMSTTPRH